MNKKEKALAICQMATLNIVLSGGGMDIDTALQQLGLDTLECFQLAQNEGFDWISEKIKINLRS